jgi:hypothetical protein
VSGATLPATSPPSGRSAAEACTSAARQMATGGSCVFAPAVRQSRRDPRRTIRLRAGSESHVTRAGRVRSLLAPDPEPCCRAAGVGQASLDGDGFPGPRGPGRAAAGARHVHGGEVAFGVRVDEVSRCSHVTGGARAGRGERAARADRRADLAAGDVESATLIDRDPARRLVDPYEDRLVDGLSVLPACAVDPTRPRRRCLCRVSGTTAA